jgi:hypothetical protein
MSFKESVAQKAYMSSYAELKGDRKKFVDLIDNIADTRYPELINDLVEFYMKHKYFKLASESDKLEETLVLRAEIAEELRNLEKKIGSYNEMK